MRLTILIIMTLLLWSDVMAHSYYTGCSGAPESNGICIRSCHYQFAFTPEVTVTGFPKFYQPGGLYTIAVAHQSDYVINQFDASVRIGEGLENGGVLSAGEGTETCDSANETNGVRWAQTDGPGRLSVTWDGKASSGRALPSGIYFCRLITPRKQSPGR